MKLSRQHVQVLLFKMESELNLSASINVRARFILKLPWYLAVFAKGGQSKSRLPEL